MSKSNMGHRPKDTNEPRRKKFYLIFGSLNFGSDAKWSVCVVSKKRAALRMIKRLNRAVSEDRMIDILKEDQNTVFNYLEHVVYCFEEIEFRD